MSQVKVRVGQTNAIKVLSSGLLSDTAFNVVGGIASVTTLTVTGAVNFGQPVQFGTGTVYIKGDEDEILKLQAQTNNLLVLLHPKLKP